MTDLKPCPFCGGKAALEYHGPTPEQAQAARAFGRDYDVAFWVECTACQSFSSMGSTRDDATSAWNRRYREAHCDRSEGCVCGGDLARVREGCSNWKRMVIDP